MSATAQRRGPAVEQALLDATVQLLTERGATVTVDDIAAATGVHKTTIYRRFTTREHLIAAAVRHLGERIVPVVEDVDPRAALGELARSVAAALRSPAGGNILRAVVAASASAPELIDLADEFFRERYEIALVHLDRLAAAGALRRDVEPVVVWEQIVNPMHVRALCGRPTSDREADALVDLALHGAAR
ncbi:TetR/AcrR family transcriptional regulator [Microbacterium invictum]|uniref:TetR/AcrR family transcriptional regulator n=1 Tax=Microbacterium invictum TaxID=515415 RepID=A0ABZ0VCG0_9MICO|nr:TetR/AcrR family transcriptional regulator [Microbacterium invictum]WQB70235.1 TetR/AcrR family transcriptional regulator [Microbacterium invictum]